MTIQTQTALRGGICTIPEAIAKQFPEYKLATYTPDVTPVPGDLCLVEANGRQFYGVYEPSEWGAIFHRACDDIIALIYRVLGVLRPVRCGQEEAWN